jgi:hypothetical protein
MPPALSTIVTDSSGSVYQTMNGMQQNVAPDIPVAEAKALAATQGRLAGKAFGQSVTVAACKIKPSWFIVTADDRVVSPALQAAEAERMEARTTVLRSSHMSCSCIRWKSPRSSKTLPPRPLLNLEGRLSARILYEAQRPISGLHMRPTLLSPSDPTPDQRPLYEDMKVGISAKCNAFTTMREDGTFLGP